MISRIISIFYTLFGESTMMAKSISVGLGTASVYMVYRICESIWDLKAAYKAAWFTTLFPTLILYSAITLREVYVVFFLLFSLMSIFKYIEKKSILSFFYTIIGFYILSFFHGPSALGGFVFLIYIISPIIKKQLVQLRNLKANLFSIFFILILSLPLLLFYNDILQIPYIGSFDELINPDYLIKKANINVIGSASYPEILIIKNNYEIIPKIILKLFYFCILLLFGM